MYKVYFNNRTAFLGKDFSGIQEYSENLVHEFSSGQELRRIIQYFSSSEQYPESLPFSE